MSQVEQALAALFDRGDALHRRLVFWYDANAEFRDAFEELAVPEGVAKMELGDTPFAVKYRLLFADPETSFLIYAPFAEPEPRKNWLLDLQTQAEIFTADRASMLFRQYRLHDRGLLRYLRSHVEFFNNKRRVSSLETIGVPSQSSEDDLRNAMMCALLGLKVADANQLIRTVLAGGLHEESNEALQELEKYFANEFWVVVDHALAVKPEPRTLRELFVRVALTHLERDLQAALPDSLGSKLIRPATRAYVFVDQWLRDAKDCEAWDRLSRQLAGDLGIPQLAQELHPGDYLKVQTFKDFDEALIRSASSGMAGEQTDPHQALGWISARKPLHWYLKYESYYAALEAAARFQAALRALPESLEGTPGSLFADYAARYFEVDQRYRQYVAASDEVDNAHLERLTDWIERAYTYSFLEPVGEAWSNALDGLDSTWALADARKQWWFFENHVRPILEKNDRDRVYVIISDALRYEVASELAEELKESLRGEPELSAMFGVLPSITKLGMAALLPGAEAGLSVSEQGDVAISGRSTAGATNRQAILNSAGFSSVTVGADELLAMTKEDGREFVKPHRVVYVYQNRIDAAGDKAASERTVFAACRDAIDEIQKLVRKIVNQFNGTNVFVTADHGFLYQRQQLEQRDKIPRPSGDVLDSGRRRAALGTELSTPEGTQTFEVPVLRPEGLKAQSPRGTLRYVLQGPGAQFVHGGASLQEVVVPLLAYKHVRASDGDEGPSHKVGAHVNVTTRKITNTHFTLRLIQDEPVGGRVRARSVLVKFVDDEGNDITNASPLNLDSAAKQATDREHIAHLSIGVADPDRNRPYYLVVLDTEDNMPIIREQWEISLAFSDDFGDF